MGVAAALVAANGEQVACAPAATATGTVKMPLSLVLVESLVDWLGSSYTTVQASLPVSGSVSRLKASDSGANLDSMS